jgi:spore maturation protein CgeB
VQAQLKIFSARSGADTARLDYPDGRRMHLHSAIAPEREHESLLDQEIWGDTVVVLGVGLGYQLDQVDFSEAKKVVLVDVYDQLLKRAATRLSNRFKNVACINASAGDRLVQALKSIPTATLQILRHPPSLRAFPEVYSALETALIRARPAPAITAFRKILLLKGTYFLEREVEEALEQATGTQLSVLDYNKHIEGVPRQAAFQSLLEKERPALILTIGFKGFDRQASLFQMAERYGIPVAVWFLDDPRPATLAFSEHIGPNIHAFVWDEAYAPWLKKRGFASVEVLPLGASDTVFNTQRTAVPTIPLSFVGSALGPDFVQKIQTRFLWNPIHQGLVDLLASQLLSGEIDAVSLVESDLPYTDEKNRTWFANVVIHTASHLKRVLISRALMDQGLETFGDPESWGELLGNTSRCHPSVDYYQELAGVYQTSAINLNITSCQMPTTVNQRLFDVPLAGGFLLTDPQADTLRLFEEDKEVVIYRSIAEAQDKVRFFTRNPETRSVIVQAAR